MATSRDDFGIAIRSALLQRGARAKFSLFFLLCISLIIFFLDINKFTAISIARNVINDGVYRLSNIASSPFKAFNIIGKKSNELLFTFKENKDLKEELENLRAKDFQVEYLISQNKFLKKTLDENRQLENKSVLAKVLLDKKSPYLKSIIINRGSKSGVTKGMPVIDGGYLVGRIVEVNYLSSRVLLLNDLNSRIPVTLGEEAVQAILTGKGQEFPKLEYLPEKYYLNEGETVFTSGKDGIFSGGIPVGKTIIDKNGASVRLFSDANQLSFVSVQLINIKEENF